MSGAWAAISCSVQCWHFQFIAGTAVCMLSGVVKLEQTGLPRPVVAEIYTYLSLQCVAICRVYCAFSG